MGEKKIKMLILAGIVVLGLVLVIGLWLRPKSKPGLEEVVVTGMGLPLELVGADGGLKRGEEKEIELILRAGEEAISGINMIMELDERYVTIKELTVNEGVFGSVFKNSIEGNGARVLLSAVNMKPSSELPKGDLKIATIKLVGKSKGKSYVVLLPETYATKVNVSDSGDNQMSLKLVNGEMLIE